MAIQSRKKKNVRLCQLSQVHGSNKKPPEYQEKFFGASLSTRPWEMMVIKEGKVNQYYSIVHNLLAYTYTLSKHVLSSFSSSKTSHALFPGSFQKNTMCLFSAKHLPMSASAKTSSHKTVSRKNITWHDESSKKPAFPLHIGAILIQTTTPWVVGPHKTDTMFLSDWLVILKYESCTLSLF